MRKWVYLVVTFREEMYRDEAGEWQIDAHWEVMGPGDLKPRPLSDIPAFRQVAVMLNNFGNEGWELVEATLVSSAVVEGMQGFRTGGRPIRQRWTFKRPAAR